MSDRAEDERLFTEEEVRALLSRAIAQQASERHHRARREHGLSLGEIQSIAADVGVDPRYVASAVADLEGSPAPIRENKLLGGPMKLDLVRTVDAPLTDATIAELAETIRSEFSPHRGHLEVVGSAFEWTLGVQSGEDLLIRTEAKEGRTTIRIQQSFATWAMLWHLLEGIPALLGVLFLFAQQNLVAGFGVLLLAAVLFFVARFLFGLSTRKRTARLEKLIDRLAAITSKAAPAAPQAEAGGVDTQGAQAPTPLLGLDLSDPADEDVHATPQRRRDTSG